MFCNYCRALNPDDSIYCSSCGQTIKVSPDVSGGRKPDLPEQNLGGTTDNRTDEGAAGSVPKSSVRIDGHAEPDGSPSLDAFSTEELQKFTNEELDDLWKAYTKLQITPSLAVQNEIKRRALHPRSFTGNLTGPVQVSNQSALTDPQPESPPAQVSQPAPTDWMTLLSTQTAQQPNRERSFQTERSIAPPPIQRAAPLVSKSQDASTTVVLRDGKDITVSKWARFPSFCIKCGEPSNTILQKTFYWHPSWLAILIFLGPLPYAIAVLAVLTSPIF
jgi:hypothetical protein